MNANCETCACHKGQAQCNLTPGSKRIWLERQLNYSFFSPDHGQGNYKSEAGEAWYCCVKSVLKSRYSKASNSKINKKVCHLV